MSKHDLSTVEGIIAFCEYHKELEEKEMEAAYRGGKPPRTHKMFYGRMMVLDMVIESIKQYNKNKVPF